MCVFFLGGSWLQICLRHLISHHLPGTLTSELAIHSLFCFGGDKATSHLKTFQEPQQLMDTFTDLEELNLFLIQSSQADAHEATSCRVVVMYPPCGWVFTHIMKWYQIFCGKQKMQMHSRKFEGFPFNSTLFRLV